MDYQSKLSPEVESVDTVSDIQIIQSPTANGGQVESERSIPVSLILSHRHYPLKFQRFYTSGIMFMTTSEFSIANNG
jgi:hypothetical protein